MYEQRRACGAFRGSWKTSSPKGTLQSIPGVGAAIAKRIEALYRGDADETLDRLRRKLPASLLELLAVPGLKPQTILKLHTLLGVNSLDELTAACSRGDVAATKGLGPRSSARSSRGSQSRAKAKAGFA